MVRRRSLFPSRARRPALTLSFARCRSNIRLPDNAPPNAKYRPICPYCAKALKRVPYSRIIWQDGNPVDDSTQQETA